MKNIVIVAILVLVVIGGGYLYKTSQKPIIQVLPATYDFGSVSQKNGKVSTEFIVKNVGKTPLKFNRVSTSCGCTVAEIDKSDLASGEGRKMKVTFDPNAHKDQYGPIARVVYMQTNDPEKSELEVQINANVTK